MALDIDLPEPGSHIDVKEKGRSKDGQTVSLDRRLFMQLFAFGGCSDTPVLIDALEAVDVEGVLYEDVNDPRGIGLIFLHEAPDYFVTTVRSLLQSEPFGTLTPKPEYTMLGRTYAMGYESDLEETLLCRPRRYVCHPAWPWAIWYPLRRSGAFEQLSVQEQRTILMEHGGIGRAYGRADYAHDIRLACHGFDKNDNDFIVGLLGRELYPLSAIVQRMCKTRQTSQYLERLGPFFVGKAVWKANRNGGRSPEERHRKT